MPLSRFLPAYPSPSPYPQVHSLVGLRPIYHCTKRIKYLGINLPKETKDLYAEKYKTLMKEIKEDTNRWRDIYHVFGMEESTL